MSLLPLQLFSGGIMIEGTQTSIVDVARYILDKSGQMTTMKLQKLCYYAQVWHSYLLDKQLFREDIQAWSYGPVSYDLFQLHRGKYQIAPTELLLGSSLRVSDSEKGIIDQVLATYGDFTGTQLSDLSHGESPWIDTRTLATQEDQSPVISVERMYAFADALNAKSK
jgi:uncharacterized phage-associated protein